MTRRRLHVVGAALVFRDRCLLGRRLPGGAYGGCWEFPGGKLEENETPEAALEREVQEELGLTVSAGEFLARGVVRTDERTLLLDVHWVELTEEPTSLKSDDHQELRWFSASELEELLRRPQGVSHVLAAPDCPAARRLLDVWSSRARTGDSR